MPAPRSSQHAVRMHLSVMAGRNISGQTKFQSCPNESPQVLREKHKREREHNAVGTSNGLHLMLEPTCADKGAPANGVEAVAGLLTLG